MLTLNEIKPGKVIIVNGEPFSIIRADHHKMGRGGAVLKTKLRNLITGAVLEKTWQGNDRAERLMLKPERLLLCIWIINLPILWIARIMNNSLLI